MRNGKTLKPLLFSAVKMINKLSVAVFVLASLLLITASTHAATYYVTTMGSDSNTCTQAQNLSTPKQHIANGMGCLRAAGDILYVRAGTYSESINVATRLGTQVGGTSFSNPILIANYPGDARPVIQAPSGQSGVLTFPGSCCGGTPQQFVIFDGFVIDAVNTGDGGEGVDMQGSNNMLRNIEVKNSPGNGILAAGSGNQFINCDLHDNGNVVNSSGGYGIYINGNDHLIERCKIHNNGGYGVHAYRSGGGANNITIRYNDIYHNSQTATNQTAGIIISSGSNHAVYGNVVRDAAGSGGGIQVNDNCVNCLVYNNTVSGNSSWGIAIYPAATGAIVKNNIVVSNSPNIVDWTSGAGATLSNNLCNVSGTGCALVGDPLFVNPASGDFSLQSTSPYINAGVGAFAGVVASSSSSSSLPSPPSNLTVVSP